MSCLLTVSCWLEKESISLLDILPFFSSGRKSKWKGVFVPTQYCLQLRLEASSVPCLVFGSHSPQKDLLEARVVLWAPPPGLRSEASGYAKAKSSGRVGKFAQRVFWRGNRRKPQKKRH